MTQRSEVPHGGDHARAPEREKLVEKACRFNCDTESSCECWSHQLHRAHVRERERLQRELAEQRAELTGGLSEMFRSMPERYDTDLDHYREMARRLSESRDVLKHENRKLRDDLTTQAGERERLIAGLRGWRDFFSGQPRELPYRNDGTFAAKESELNFAWCVGYDSAADSEVYRLMVGRADKAQATGEALSAADARIASLSEQLEKLRDGLLADAVDCGDPIMENRLRDKAATLADLVKKEQA